MRNTAKKVEARLIKINEYLDTDYELQYMRDYDYPYKIVSHKRSHDESQRLTVSEAIEWTNGVINAYFALYDRLTVSRSRQALGLSRATYPPQYVALEIKC